MEDRPSRTALTTSLMRSLHGRTDPLRLLDDPWGDRLVGERVWQAVAQRAIDQLPADKRAAAEADRHATADRVLHANPAYANVVTRSRYAEDALHEAIARGVRQYVLIGAGFDSYGLRVPASAAGLRVYEIDHPATQTYKLRRLEECGVARPAALRFIEADLSREALSDVLARSDFRRGEPAFFSWLGVTMYLTHEANLQALKAIAACSAAGSELVFTYIDADAFSPESGTRFRQMQQLVSQLGEPFLSGFDPNTLKDELRACGFELVEDLTDRQLVDRYDPQGLNGFTTGGYGRIARARVNGDAK